MLHLEAKALVAKLGPLGLADALAKGHRSGIDDVARVLLTEPRIGAPDNHLLVWPAWRFACYCGVKIVSVFPGNGPERPTNATVYVLFDGKTGAPLATIEGSAFTTAKTAADSALAAGYLARADARTLLMVGAGAQAGALIAAHLAMRPSVQEVLIWNRTADKAEQLARALDETDRSFRAVADLDAALPEADIISCATASTTPIIRGALLKPGSHLDLVGGFTNAMREADDDAARRSRIFVDSRRFAIGECGDITGPIEAGIIDSGDIAGDLFDLCRGTVTGRCRADEITLFKNAGGGHLDLMTAIALYEMAREP